MKIEFILVGPKVPENIGASARAIKTMGFDSLVLVDPCEWKEGKARWVAHGAYDILDNASVFKTLKNAITDSDFIIATSAKQRTVKQDYIDVSALNGFLKSRNDTFKKVSLVFGREESGLTNDEMKLCDVTSSIPMVSPFPSLNLSQAVMVYAYCLSEHSRGESLPVIDQNNSESFRRLKSRIKKVLAQLGIDENDNRFGRIMERISFINADDINLLHSVSALISEKIEQK
jgi:tRNA/rRNA methyltransferase